MTYVRNNPASFVTARAAAVAAYSPWYRDLRVLNVLIAAGTAAFFIGYLVLNNQATSKGFEARSMEKRISALQDQRQKLDLEVVAGQSMDALTSKIQGLGLVPVTAVDYLNGGSGAVAVK